MQPSNFGTGLWSNIANGFYYKQKNIWIYKITIMILKTQVALFKQIYLHNK